MDYCLGAEDGTASMWSGTPDVDTDGDGVFDGVALDFDRDGLLDDALVDLDGDGVAEYAVLDLDGDAGWFTDDGSGTWAVPADGPGRPLRWLSLDGLESTGGPMVDFDADGAVDDLLVDSDSDGLADRVLSDDGRVGYVDTDGDGRWDVKLADADGDGAADSAQTL
ncbi:pullulanase [Mycobacterium sp. MS1601]|uniref:pullulanase n=1 Tax=Mycobacterium sp. MS1601 TaxID=1936029 RepID=UPI000979819A|nr:pullulanase [Mycobacterium sp. MS1601]AQA03061.1 pullulanase [Mycobacterium sp. MS1601]